MTVTITFKPAQALFYRSIAYCNISCCEKVLVVNIDGVGKGPKAEVLPTWKDIGDVFIDELVTENITITNGG
jgi:hydrocephalus-inducing protein